MNFGPVETLFIFLSLLTVILVSFTLTRKFPFLSKFSNRVVNTLIVIGLVIFTIYVYVSAYFSIQLITSPLGIYFPFLDGSVVDSVIYFPFIGGVFINSLVYGTILVAGFLFLSKQGTLKTVFLLFPLWVGLHDGIFFLVTDLAAGHVPFLYTEMLNIFPLSYFGQFYVDFWQFFCIIIPLVFVRRLVDISYITLVLWFGVASLWFLSLYHLVDIGASNGIWWMFYYTFTIFVTFSKGLRARLTVFVMNCQEELDLDENHTGI